MKKENETKTENEIDVIGEAHSFADHNEPNKRSILLKATTRRFSMKRLLSTGLLLSLSFFLWTFPAIGELRNPPAKSPFGGMINPGSWTLLDDNLNKCIKDQYEDGVKLQDITKLNCSNYGIRYLRGIFLLRNLQELDLSNNEIDESQLFLLRDLSSLKKLNLKNNRLGRSYDPEYSPVLYLGSLEELDISDNYIRAMRIGHHPWDDDDDLYLDPGEDAYNHNLKRLDFSNNDMHHLEGGIANFHSLTHLEFSNNKLETHDIEMFLWAISISKVQGYGDDGPWCDAHFENNCHNIFEKDFNKIRTLKNIRIDDSTLFSHDVEWWHENCDKWGHFEYPDHLEECID